MFSVLPVHALWYSILLVFVQSGQGLQRREIAQGLQDSLGGKFPASLVVYHILLVSCRNLQLGTLRFSRDNKGLVIRRIQ